MSKTRKKTERKSVKDVVMHIINSELDYARKKHPVFPASFHGQVSVITEEVGEFAQATNEVIDLLDRNGWKPTTEVTDRVVMRMVECAHVIVTGIRAMETFMATDIDSADVADKMYSVYVKAREVAEEEN